MRKFLSITAVPMTGPTGSAGAAVLFAVADDGTAWRAVSEPKNVGQLSWSQITALPASSTPMRPTVKG